MRRKLIHITHTAILLMLVSMAVSAQVGQLRGRVLFKQKDGTTVPLEGAVVDVFRTDLPGSYPTKTGKDGLFVFAGLPYVGTYVIAASSINAKPNVVANVKAGRDFEYEIVLESGDGQRLTTDEALTAAKALKAAETPRAETPFEIVGRTFLEGNQALARKDYNEAIRLYDEGLAAAPQTAPLLVNKAVALKARGVESYNSAIGFIRDQARKQTTMNSARKDFIDAADAATKAVEMIKIEPIPADETEQRRQQGNKYAALSARAEAMRLLVTKVDPSQAAAGLVAFQEYVDLEDDPSRKSRAELDAARMLLESKNTSLAIEQYRGILIRDPSNVDALAGLGLALYQSGDKNRFVEALGYLQLFIKEAPETHLMREPVMEVLKKLKSVR
jgi:tetratricopeptide (TPR) repeat protein